jgi:hypothetical protein
MTGPNGRNDRRNTVTRRGFMTATAVLALARVLPVRARPSQVPDGPILVYIGTYTPNGKGIHLHGMDPATGALGAVVN